MWSAFDTRRIAGLASVVGAILIALCAVLATSPQNEDAVAAIFPPWWDGPRAFEAAAGVGDIAAVGRWPTVIILSGKSKRLAPQLRSAGALFIVAAGSFIGCAQTVRGDRK
jgi:hypothetical protein